MSDRASVRAMLVALAAPTARYIRSRRARRALVDAISSLRLSLLAVPLAYLVVVTVAATAGTEARLAWYVVGALWLSLPLAVVLFAVLRSFRARVTDIAALAAIDREQQLQDRLSAAREFVDLSEPDGFQLAAIRDAERRLEAARAARPAFPEAEPTFRRGFLLHASLALVALWSAERIVPLPAGAGAPQDPHVVEIARTGGTRLPEVEAAVPTPRPTAALRPGQPEPGDEAATDDKNPTQTQREGRDPLGSGRSAESRNIAGGGADRGQPSRQAQGTNAREPERSKPNVPKPSEERQEPPQVQQPAEEQESGGTEGRGSGRGSSRSPTASPWASKDQVVSDDQKELESDEDIVDQQDESDARGGLQPQLRQRKPPVNRDLQVGFGQDSPNEDANGRGGPSGAKKQRGVAQLVLSVRFPDHLTAPPNPGRSKITQERIEPQSRQSERIDGEDRGRRAMPTGPLAQRVLSPWMQDLVRKFFSRQRTKSRTE